VPTAPNRGWTEQVGPWRPFRKESVSSEPSVGCVPHLPFFIDAWPKNSETPDGVSAADA